MNNVIAPASKPQELFLTLRDGTGKRSKWATEDGEEVDIVFYGGQAGGGKRISNDTPVLTDKGWVDAGNVTHNHRLVSIDGSYTRIVGIYPKKDMPTYKVTFADGQKILADDDHLWKVRSLKHGHRDGWLVRTTSQLVESKDRWCVPLLEKPTDGLKWNGPDPYTLGYILGDGTLTGKYTTIYSVDEDSIEYLKNTGWRIYDYESQNTIMCQYIKEDFRDVLGKVSGDSKFIPKELLRADLDTRLELLRGLMDSDGTIGNDGSASFITTNDNLRDGVMELVRSLGGRSYYRKVYKETNRGGRGWYYKVKVSYGTKFNPFKLKRKAERVVQQKLDNLRIKSIERVENTDGVCFTVEHPSHLFVVDGYVVTHNSYASLMHHLKYIHIPYYKGIIIRRTTPMLTKPGAIWDEAKALYKQVDPQARIRTKDMKINFGPIPDLEKKAEVSFTHFENVNDTQNFQGSQLSSAVLDELCQFEESQFLYILSRLRTKAAMKPVIRATMNPDPDSWVRKWVDWYLYPKDHELYGRPDPSKQAVIRWFIRQNDEMIWAESRAELYEKYGRKDENGIPLPEEHPKQIKPLSFSFISASVYDNPYIEANYIAFLEGLGRIEKEILLYGSWEARAEGSGYFKREWVEVIPLPPVSTVQSVRAWDISGTLPSDTNPNPDWTVGALMTKDKNSMYYVEDIVRDRRRYGGVFDLILETAYRDGYETKIIIPRDPGAAGAAYSADIIRQLAEYGFVAKARPTNKSKVQRFAPFAALAEAGGVRVVKSSWNDVFFAELERFDGSRNVKDD